MWKWLGTLLSGLAMLAPGYPASAASPAPGGISPAELNALVQRHAPVVIVDVRNPRSFAKRHLPGAVSVPWERLPKFVAGLSAKTVAVTYCACPHDETSSQAVTLLRKKYHLPNTRYLQGGIDRWILLGLPFDLGPDTPPGR